LNNKKKKKVHVRKPKGKKQLGESRTNELFTNLKGVKSHKKEKEVEWDRTRGSDIAKAGKSGKGEVTLNTLEGGENDPCSVKWGEVNVTLGGVRMKTKFEVGRKPCAIFRGVRGGRDINGKKGTDKACEGCLVEKELGGHSTAKKKKKQKGVKVGGGGIGCCRKGGISTPCSRRGTSGRRFPKPILDSDPTSTGTPDAYLC